MLDWFSKDSDDAVSLLKKDHDKVKDLFSAFEKAEKHAAQKKIADEAILELKIHAELEEKIFYPAVRKKVGSDIMNEADEEHHVAKVLIAELEEMNGRGDHWEAKFTVLSELVKHHIKEEEGEMLPKARTAKLDFDALGEKMLAFREKLLTDGFPVLGEKRMVEASKGKGDSPARAARTTKSPAAKKRQTK